MTKDKRSPRLKVNAWKVGLLAAVLAAAPMAASAACLGDCNGNNGVSAGELTKIITIINLCGGTAAGCPTVPGTDKQCINADKNGNGTISAGELTNIISNIINIPGGCPVAKTPTPTVLSASPTPTATPTASGPPLGLRTFSFGATGSGFFTSLVGGGLKVGTPTGTLVLSAGPTAANGQAAVTLSNGPVILKTDLAAGGISLCAKVESCTGTLYCNGGANVDVTTDLDSLAAGLTCVRDGTKGCPSTTGNVCCSNACEGVGVGSGNSIVKTSGVNPGTDSGAGAMLLLCQERIVPMPYPPGNCAGADYSAAALQTQYYTTGTSTAHVPNHCVGSGAKANVVPTFAKSGQNFSCASWTTENGAGRVAYTIPSEEGSAIISGDGANAGIYSDQ